MSLPFADNPDKSSIYNDLKVKKLLDLTAEDFDAFRARMDAQGVDGLEDEYRRLLLLGLASDKLSISGPMPGTVDVVTFSSSSSGSGVGLDQTGFWTTPGSSWKLYAPSISVGGGSGSIQHELRLIRDGRTVELLDFSTTGGSLRPTTEEGFIGGEIIVSHPAYIIYEASGTFTNATMALAVVRER
tara:strand:+ start:193 stop:750 length:558 start_codon:yes stop_codon:yes gene_type:complete